jgi:hypothetical protein
MSRPVFYIWNAVLLASQAQSPNPGQAEEHVGDDYNTRLAAAGGSDIRKGSSATIEDPARVENLCWQTRPAPLTPDENSLADALQSIFAGEVYDLHAIVDRLNQMKIAPPTGASGWTEENFRTEMRRLADLTVYRDDRS